MGSSPFTATTPLPTAPQPAAPQPATPRPAAPSRLLAVSDRFLATLAPGRPLVVAFSGGFDSCALLWALALGGPRHGVAIHAAHFNHQLDADSDRRAERAVSLANLLAVPVSLGLRDRSRDRRGDSPEALARRCRYAFLEAERARLGAQAIATAHHLDDQAETVLLRLLYGSGVSGLAGIRPVHGWLRRPLLSLRRQELRAALVAASLAASDDPTNRDLAVPRNRVRGLLLPLLERDQPRLPERLASLATTVAAAAPTIERRLTAWLRAESEAAGASCDLAALRELAPALRPYALAALHRLAGHPWPPRRRAQTALFESLAADTVSLDSGGGWRWRRLGTRLRLEATPSAVAPFTYTFSVPGSCVVPEIGVRMTVRKVPAAEWMWHGSPNQAGFTLPEDRVGAFSVRNRRPGDRLRPLGGAGVRRLKELLVDRKVPRAQRDRLPLLCWGGQIVWVPGLTVAHAFRLRERNDWVWLAALESTSAVVES